MGISFGRQSPGRFDNGSFDTGSNDNFTFASVYSGDSYSGKYSLLFQSNGSPTRIGSQYISVDTSMYHRMTLRARTIQTSTPNAYSGYGHLGFACYDQSYNFIDLRNCGGIGNTTLTRALNPGDAYAYVTSVSGWSTNANSIYRHFLIFPPTHPLYSAGWKYTRIGYGDYNICHSTIFTQISANEWQVALQNTSNVDTPMPTIGYSLPIGTPISVGQAGGTYNYAFGAPTYPSAWTLYDTGWFTGESVNSSLPFRYGTKFIRFMHLENYGRTAETVPAKYLMDDIRWFTSPVSGGGVPL